MFIALKRFLIAVCLLFVCLFSDAQQNARIKYLGGSQGLSNNSVRAIFQDSRGLMWFGTYDGLDRYDGYEFKVLRNRINDSTSLPHNYITAINEDDKFNLWVGMGNGAVTYDIFTNIVTPIYFERYSTKEKVKVASYVYSIDKDEKGNMFLASTSSGLLVKFKGKTFAEQVPIERSDNITQADFSVQATCMDTQKRIWAFVSGVGLLLYNYTTNRLEIVDATLANYSVNKLLTDASGNLWVGTKSGLLQYATSQKRIVATYQHAPGQLSAAYVTDLDFDKNGRLLIGTDGGGIDILDIASGRIEKFRGGRQSSLSSDVVLTIFIDKESREWIGTHKGGVNVIDVAGNEFHTVKQGAVYPTLSSNFITAFFEDPQDNLWVGTDGGGLNVWNAARTHFNVYKTPVLSNNAINSITQDAEGNIWIATFGGGVNRMTKNGNVKHYRLVGPDGGENNIAIRVFCDSENNVWATTFENGRLYLLNRTLDHFEAFDTGIGDLMSMMEDRQHVLWVGSPYSLIRLDKVNKKHDFFEIKKTVRAIYEDSKGRFWIGSEGGGLILFDRKAGKIETRYSEEDGLSSNIVMNILEDGAGNLWISTSNGLNKFNPETKKFNRFYESDGLQNNQFSYRAALKLRSGELAFGGNEGFNIFDPSKITVRTYFPKVVITSLRINNQPITDDNKFTVDAQGDIKGFSVPYDEAILSIQFAALEYSAPGKIQYAYYLEGWDKDWNFSGNGRAVTYNNIREGSYRFRIKSTNADGTWNDKEAVVLIKILPPWYRTWWAYLVYVLAFFSAIYVYLSYKTAQARMKYELEVSKLNADMRKAELESERMEKEVQRAELEKTNAEYEKEKAERETERVINEKEKDINQKRLSFFTNISHEFRTPLTMIINPVQELVQQSKGKEKEELEVIGRNANRLLSLTDQLLLFRKIEEGAEGIKVSRFDFSKLCNTVFYYFKHEAKTKHIDYYIIGIEDPLMLYGDKSKIEIVLYNLIANAFKYTPENGCIQIRVQSNGEMLTTQVADSGHGIPTSAGNAIFDRFYQAEGHVKSGFGIGLYMVRQFAEMHHGTIRYDSVEQEGTTFVLELPMGKTHFGNIPIDETLEDDDANLELHEEFDIDEDSEVFELPAMPTLSSKRSVLVADDDEEIRNYVASIFSENYVVYKAKNGNEALKIAKAKRPDLIISDVSMPGMDGITLCKMIKEDENINHLPVILLTAHTSQDVELKGTEEGADYYITKPFSRDILQARVNSIFKSRESLQQYFYNQVTLKEKNTEDNKVPVEYQELLDKCIAIVEKHLDDPTFNIEMLAREMAMSHSNLYKRIKLISGQSVNSFIRFLRLRKGAELLLSTNDTVTDVAYKVGFSDVKYFREQFAKLFNMKPTEYIKTYRGKVVPQLRVDRENTD